MKIKASILLALAYLIGQGSVFLSQVTIKALGHHELTGLAVLIVSIFSFAYQFSDFGNPTFVNKCLEESNEVSARLFIYSRAFIGFLITLAFSLYAYVTSPELSVAVVIMMPLCALLYGFSVNGYLENKSDYAKIAVLQAAPWLITALVVLLLLNPSVEVVYLWVILLLVAFFYVIVSYYFAGRNFTTEVSVTLKSLINALAFIVGPISGQIWGRIVILLVGQHAGLIALGIFGLIKYIQVASSLSTSFIARPIIAQLAREKNIGGVVFVVRHSSFLLITMMVGPFSYLCIGMLSYLGLVEYEYMKWAVVLNVTPLWSIAYVSYQLNQIVLRSREIVVIDKLSLLANIAIFFMIYKKNLPLAVFLGESVSALMVILLSIYARKKYKLLPV